MWSRAASVAVLDGGRGVDRRLRGDCRAVLAADRRRRADTAVSSLVFPVVVAREGGCSSVVFPRGGVLATTRPAGGSFAGPPQTLGTLLGGEYPEVAFGGWCRGRGLARRLLEAFGSQMRRGATRSAQRRKCRRARARRITRRWPSTRTARRSRWSAAGLAGSRRAYVSERPAGGSPSAADAVADWRRARGSGPGSPPTTAAGRRSSSTSSTAATRSTAACAPPPGGRPR